MWDPLVTSVRHPGYTNVKFLFLKSACSWKAPTSFPTSCSLDCRFTRGSMMRPSKPGEAKNLSESSPRQNPRVRAPVESSLTSKYICRLLTVTQLLTIQPCDLPDSCHDGELDCSLWLQLTGLSPVIQLSDSVLLVPQRTHRKLGWFPTNHPSWENSKSPERNSSRCIIELTKRHGV